jgi:toxin ParE1/3/4
VSVFFTKAAERDLVGIWHYIARDSEAAATRVIHELRDRCQVLSSHPLMGETCEDLRPGLRRFSVGWYVVYYRVGASRVSIARVLHGARDVNRLF